MLQLLVWCALVAWRVVVHALLVSVHTMWVIIEIAQSHCSLAGHSLQGLLLESLLPAAVAACCPALLQLHIQQCWLQARREHTRSKSSNSTNSFTAAPPRL